MDSLYLKFFDKRDYRKWNLFNLINNSDSDEIQLGELKRNYKMSKKTLFADLDILNLDLVEIYQSSFFKVDKKRGVVKRITTITYSSLLIQYYIKKSRLFLIFNLVLTNPEMNSDEVQRRLFYSSSTVYTSCNQLNLFFSSFSLSFSLKGLRGNERLIRHILVEMYWVLFGGNSWPFEKERKEFIHEFEYSGLKIETTNWIEREKILYWFAITDMRIKINSGIYSIDNSVENNEEKIFDGLLSVLKKKVKHQNKAISLESECQFLSQIINSFAYNSPEMVGNKIMSKIAPLDSFCLKKIKEKKLTEYTNKQLQFRLRLVKYYYRENLLDWYHYLEPEAMIYYRKISPYLEDEIKEKSVKLANKIVSAYIFECQKSGVYFNKPLPLIVHSKEGRILQLIQLFKQHSPYPVEVVNENHSEHSILLTNSLIDYEKHKNNKKKCLYYEWPLDEKKIVELVTKAFQLTKQSRNEAY